MFEFLKKKNDAAVMSQKSYSPMAFISMIGSMFGYSRGKKSRSDLENAFQGWVSSCILARAEDVGNIRLKLFKQNKKKVEEIQTHELLDMLYGFDQTLTKSEGFGVLSMHLDIFGQAYWFFDKKLGTITPLMPDKMMPELNADGSIKQWIYDDTNQQGKVTKYYEPEQILRFRIINPFNLDGGRSIVEDVYDWIETEVNASKWNRNFFRNNAIPSALLQPKMPMGVDTEKRLKTSFEEAYQGTNNAHKIGLLPAGVDFVKLQETMKDMSFGELDMRYQNKILAAFRVPKTRLGITEDVNRANAEASYYVYMRSAIEPTMRKIVETLNEYLTPLFGENLFLDFVSPVPQDEDLKIRKVQAALGGQSYMTINEARSENGLPSVDGGDKVMTTFNFVPLNSSNGQQDQQKEIAPYLNHRKVKNVEKVGGEMAEKVVKYLTERIKGYADTSFDAEDHKNFVLRGEKNIPAARSAVQKANGKVEEKVMSQLEKLVNKLKDTTVFDDEEEIYNIFVDETQRTFEDIALAEAKQAAKNLGSEYKITEELKKQMEKYMEKLGKSYTDTTVDLLKTQIKQGLTDGLNIKEIATNIKRDVFDYSDEVRANAIANTEVFRFANIGLRDGFAESGVVQTVRWYTAADEMVCEFCEPQNGTVVDVTELFYDQGDQVVGKDGGLLDLDYSDIYGGALHPNCRCYVRPDKISVT